MRGRVNVLGSVDGIKYQPGTEYWLLRKKYMRKFR